ncbi:MAG: hypothetical protein APR63_10010 [Desulfuromonas sp. SDB]|nr:MAG: hypothetical protein APR63_10010 [Desulfuromonas sp. SDB]
MEEIKSDNLEFDYQSVFEVDDYLYFYEDGLTAERTEREVNFLIEQMGITPSHRILDIPCGFGRHTNLLAEKGFEITGVDFSSGFLEIAEKEAKERGLTVNYIQEDMRNIAFREEFERIFMAFTSFGYFNDNENIQVIKNFYKALKPGGLLCFDTFNRDQFLKKFLPFIVSERGDDLMIDRNRFDCKSGRLYNRRMVIRNGQIKQKPFFVRLYNYNEINQLLTEVGFKIKKVLGNWRGDDFTFDSFTMITIAEK